MSAFAVFCATDGSLTFYNRDTVPSVGSTFEGKVASNVYTGFDTAGYSSATAIPWYPKAQEVISVSFTQEFATVKPVKTAYWFYECQSLSSIDCIYLDTSNVNSMKSMFYNCSSITSLYLSGFDTSNVVDMATMFGNCTSLETIYVSESWSTSAVTKGANMFMNCSTSLVGAVPYDSTKTDERMANYETGYFTYKRYVIPEDMLIKNTTLYNLADKIRILSNSKEDMIPSQMVAILSNIHDAKGVQF